LENHQQIGYQIQPNILSQMVREYGFANFEKHCKHLKIEANDKEDHLIKGIVDKTKVSLHMSHKLENMSTCLRLFHLNIV
jgi:hypothetical protein